MEVKSKPKHPKSNEEATKHKNGLLVTSKWAAKASYFISFDCDNLTTEHYYFMCSRPEFDMMKILTNTIRPQNIVLFILMFCDLVIFINFNPINVLEHPK